MQLRTADSTVTVPVPNHKELRIGALRSIIRQSNLLLDEFVNRINQQAASPRQTPSLPNAGPSSGRPWCGGRKINLLAEIAMICPYNTLVSLVWHEAPLSVLSVVLISVVLVILGVAIMRCSGFRAFVVIFPTLSLLPFLVSLALSFYKITQFLGVLGSSGFVGPAPPDMLLLCTISSSLAITITASFVSAAFFCWAIILFLRFRPQITTLRD
jgi:hypothetical protein